MRAIPEISIVQDKWAVSTPDPYAIHQIVARRLQNVGRYPYWRDEMFVPYMEDVLFNMRLDFARLYPQRRRGAQEDFPEAFVRNVMHRLQALGRSPIPCCRGMPFLENKMYMRRQLHMTALTGRGLPRGKMNAVMSDLMGDLSPFIKDLDDPAFTQPLTPRRMFTPVIIEDDPFRPGVPKALPVLGNGSYLDDIHAELEFWLRTLAWLKGLLSMMDNSVAKAQDDLIVLDSGPETIGVGSNTRTYWRRREVIPSIGPFHFSDCSLDPKFFGPACIPRVAGVPSNNDILTIASFKERHHNEKLKHLHHLFFLYDMIEEDIIPRVEDKLQELVNSELGWFEKKKQEDASTSDIDYEHLKNADADKYLEALSAGLDSKEWVIVCKALSDLQALAKYHKKNLQQMMEIFIPKIARLVKKGRPAVAKSAMRVCLDLILVYGDSLIKFADPVIASLVVRSFGLHKFIAKEAQIVLVSLVRSLPISPAIMLSKVVPLLQRSTDVRENVLLLLGLCLPVPVLERNEFIVHFATAMKAQNLVLWMKS